MHDEKNIERWDLIAENDAITEMDDGGFVTYTDHLEALGEAQKRGQEGWDLCNEECQRSRFYEAKLETLRSGLKAEVERLREQSTSYAEAASRYRSRVDLQGAEYAQGVTNGFTFATDRLEQLLDASEDTGSVGVGIEGSDTGSPPRRDLALDADSSADEITLPLVEAMALLKPERVLEAEEFWGEACDRAERKILAIMQPETLARLDAINGVCNEYEVVDPPPSFTGMAGEDTEKQSDLHSRSTIAYVAGHLEGYASMLGRLGTKANLRALIESLREDAEKLRQSGGAS